MHSGDTARIMVGDQQASSAGVAAIGRRRHRVFAYRAYLEILSEGAQPP